MPLTTFPVLDFFFFIIIARGGFARRMSKSLSERVMLEEQRLEGCGGGRKTCGSLEEWCSGAGNSMCEAMGKEGSWPV